jgi:hypothetical protein
MAPRAPKAPTGTTLNLIEARLKGGMFALNRFLMTLQNKRMPVAGFTVGRNEDGMRAAILLDCSLETARRYAALLSGLEDVEEIGASDVPIEVALLEVEGDTWRQSAAHAGIEAHEDGNTVVASGEPEMLEAWLVEIRDEVKDLVRLGPIARPGEDGGV